MKTLQDRITDTDNTINTIYEAGREDELKNDLRALETRLYTLRAELKRTTRKSAPTADERFAAYESAALREW